MLYRPVCVLVGAILQCFMKRNVNFDSGIIRKEPLGCSTKLHCLAKGLEGTMGNIPIYIRDCQWSVAISECLRDNKLKPTSPNITETAQVQFITNTTKEKISQNESITNGVWNTSTKRQKTMKDFLKNTQTTPKSEKSRIVNAMTQGQEIMQGSYKKSAIATTKVTSSPTATTTTTKATSSTTAATTTKSTSSTTAATTTAISTASSIAKTTPRAKPKKRMVPGKKGKRPGLILSLLGIANSFTGGRSLSVNTTG